MVRITAQRNKTLSHLTAFSFHEIHTKFLGNRTRHRGATRIVNRPEKEFPAGFDIQQVDGPCAQINQQRRLGEVGIVENKSVIEGQRRNVYAFSRQWERLHRAIDFFQ